MAGDPVGSLGRLNEDVCHHILSKLPMGDLMSLSTTCRPLRWECMPFLFRCVYITVYGPRQVQRSGVFSPAWLRPYVRTLVIHDKCLDQGGRTDNYMRCGAFPGSALAERLREFPHLRSLTMHKDNSSTHGLSWETLSAILSVPHLREFTLRWLYFCPDLRPAEELNLGSPAPITSFNYRMYHPREPFNFPTETAALAAALSKLCGTLEVLILSSEPAPLPTFPQLHWPRLRTLAFYGMPWTTLPGPFVSLFPRMQALRSLSLKLYATSDVAPQALWPSGHSYSFPWPDLERLVITFPDPQDEIYDHLPSTLHALSLRSWPHLHVQRRWQGFWYPWRQRENATLDSSAMLSILHRCRTLDLVHLEVEYHTGKEDDTLLRYVATTFPGLTSLKIHRYQSGEGQPLSAVHIAHLLAPLINLCRLKLYVDVAVIPQQIPHTNVLRDAATRITQILGSLREIVICSRDYPSWRTYRVLEGVIYGP
ncbi:uncharacterized protein C8Q71DRAFT_776083 [Rhodofomes roseus]|uniref:F-box domain-containing protein n=1 Tax=Rhodofomes roseus TaxID=34475 RepID=A0ABQ8K700_9APHY|nr:uncharacterized protein C8Q71DRAFT_776083 [Rhodofomes roseus]KAH9833030.1 hypothetical protein C8Q71DRAFT_776083 [Rhodofomes roseus]